MQTYPEAGPGCVHFYWTHDSEDRTWGTSTMPCGWGHASRCRSSPGRKSNRWVVSPFWFWPLFLSSDEVWLFSVDRSMMSQSFPFLFGRGRSENKGPTLPDWFAPLPFPLGAFGLPLPMLDCSTVERGLVLGKEKASSRMESSPTVERSH